MTPKYSPILWWPQKKYQIFISPKNIRFSENPKNIEIQNFEPKTELTNVWKYQCTPPPPPPLGFWEPFLKYKNVVFSGEQEKNIHYLCEDGIERSIPQDHRLSSLGKTRDANQWSSGWIFLSHPHTHDGLL